MNGWMGGWVDGRARLRIAYSNQYNLKFKILNFCVLKLEVENFVVFAFKYLSYFKIGNCTEAVCIYSGNHHMLIFVRKILVMEGWMDGTAGFRIATEIKQSGACV